MSEREYMVPPFEHDSDEMPIAATRLEIMEGAQESERITFLRNYHAILKQSDALLERVEQENLQYESHVPLEEELARDVMQFCLENSPELLEYKTDGDRVLPIRPKTATDAHGLILDAQEILFSSNPYLPEIEKDYV